jgi:hypothetical protein
MGGEGVSSGVGGEEILSSHSMPDVPTLSIFFFAFY